MSFEDFCGSVFWDEYLTWNTTNPDFTPCFQKTLLVWVPCGFLWLFTPLQLKFIFRHERKFIPWTSFNIMKIICCLILIVCSLFQLIYITAGIYENQIIYPVDYIYLSIEAITYLLALIFGVIHVRVGIHSSTLLLFFWLLQTVAGAVRYRSTMMKAISEMEIVDSLSFSIAAIEFPLIFAQLVLSCFADRIIPSKHEEKNPYPVTYASPVSFVTYAFYDRIAWQGFKKPLVKDDLWALNKNYKAEQAYLDYERLEKADKVQTWRKIPGKEAKILSPSLTKIIWHMVKWDFITGILIKYVGDLLAFVSPLMLRQLINFVSSDEPLWKGILYALTLFLATSTGMLCMNFHFYRMQSIGIRTRAAVISAIYRKTLHMSSAAKRSSTVGEIVTLMSVDAQRIMDLWQYLGHAFSMPLQVTLALILLWNILGISVLIGLLIIILVIPVNAYIANITSKFQIRLMKQKDQRTKLMNEILGGMKILKLYAWELPFYNEVNKIRSSELVSLRKILLIQAFTTFLFQCTPFLISLSSFATFVLSDPSNILDAATAFVSLSLFDIMRVPLNFVPMVIAIVIQSYVSVKRIDKFMANEDLDAEAVLHEYQEDPVMIKNGTFAWNSEDAPILQNINFKASDGQLVAVIGSVGSGKSSLISCLLGEMEKIEGYVNTRGTIGYVAQQAWIQNATLRSNVTFGMALNTTKYQEIIEACALQPDLEILPGGDMTEIGEKGINLSGGQKQRVSLARAVYRDSDIYLLDDPLSAVDAHVGKHIFEKVIGPNGLLHNKTRILVTHGIAYLPYVDVIAVLTNGTISEMGSYKSMIEAKGAFADFIMNYLTENEQLDEVEAAELLEIQDGLLSTIANENVKRQLSERISRALSSDEESSSSGILSPTLRRRRTSSRLSNAELLPKEKEAKADGKLIIEEQMEIGKVDWAVYVYYIRSMGILLSTIMFFSLGLSWTSSVGSNVWLSIWSNDQPLPDGTQDENLRDLRLGVYGSFGIGQALFSFAGSITLAWGTVRASRYLHNCMLMNVLRCPMAFFDTTPLGRIVNRFSRDVDATDITIPTFLRPVLDCFFQIIGTVVVISLGTPLFLAAFVPLGIIYYFIQRLYIDSSRQLKRLESVSRSPIYSQFSETITGIMTIRAYQVQNSFIASLENKVDDNHILYYPILTAKRWLGVRLEGVGDLVVLFASLFSVLSRDTLEPGVVGLSISYSLSVTFVLMWLVRNWTDLESNIVSVERMKEYSQLDSESEWELETLKPKLSWPDKGEVQFHDYSTRYREGLDLVLKGISCDIRSKEKVGIVGRTGAGKSSLTLSLFRLIEAAEGTITVDGVDISQLGLHDLRSRLTIIPQDPVLFCGTLRLNLDPVKKYTDNEIWQALELSYLKEFVMGLPAGLEHDITEGGENLSVGQRQLVCLARALLRKSKVLVLDEATAAVDLETDDLIQATIRKEFSDCTVITIAHRLNTIMESDRVIVLDQGLIKEFDSPAALLRNKESIFYSMAKDAGLV